MIKVLNEMNHIAYEAETLDKAKEWILSHAFTIKGTRIYRFWQTAEGAFWDVGKVYHIVGIVENLYPIKGE